MGREKKKYSQNIMKKPSRNVLQAGRPVDGVKNRCSLPGRPPVDSPTIVGGGGTARPHLDAVQVVDVRTLAAAPDGRPIADHLAAHHTLVGATPQLLDEAP